MVLISTMKEILTPPKLAVDWGRPLAGVWNVEADSANQGPASCLAASSLLSALHQGVR